MTTQSELIRAQNLERAALIDRLSTAHRILAGVKGVLEANKMIAAIDMGSSFTEIEQRKLDEITSFLAGGLFGEAGK